MSRATATGFRRLLPPLLTLLLALATWDLAVRLLDLKPFLVPGPLRVGRAASDHAADLSRACLLTGGAALCGLAMSLLAGFAAALVFCQARLIEVALYPYAVFLQTVPIVAIAPLIILWMGPGFAAVVAVSFILSLFPVLANTTAGLTAVSSAHLDLFRLYRASRWQTLFRLRLPHALPHLVTGARISSGLSVIGAVVGEFSAGYGSDSHGLGYLIIFTSGQIKTDLLFACVLSCTLLGWCLFSAVSWSGRRILAKAHLEPV